MNVLEICGATSERPHEIKQAKREFAEWKEKSADNG